jgi:tRNA(fMet)-specific endonuclease VapC
MTNLDEGGDEDAEAVLIDTDVFIELMAGGDRAARWLSLVEGRYGLISFVTAGEVKAGVEIQGWGQKKRDDLAKRFNATVTVPYDAALVDEYARVYAEARRMNPGHALGGKQQSNDRWIATARLLGVPLLTNNRRHFEGLPGLDLVDEPTDTTIE